MLTLRRRCNVLGECGQWCARRERGVFPEHWPFWGVRACPLSTARPGELVANKLAPQVDFEPTTFRFTRAPEAAARQNRLSPPAATPSHAWHTLGALGCAVPRSIFLAPSRLKNRRGRPRETTRSGPATRSGLTAPSLSLIAIGRTGTQPARDGRRLGQRSPPSRATWCLFAPGPGILPSRSTAPPPPPVAQRRDRIVMDEESEQLCRHPGSMGRIPSATLAEAIAGT